MDKSVQEIYGNRLRVRACGICPSQGGLLMVNHQGLREGSFWAPPGGGVEFGQSVPQALLREFREETGLEVEIGPLLFATEYFQHPLHALELFFSVNPVSGTLRTGYDPEMKDKKQLIREVRFMSFQEIDALPREEKHGAFGLVGRSAEISGLNGYFRI